MQPSRFIPGAESVTTNRAETAGKRLRAVLENAAQFVRVLAIKAAGGFHRRIGFAAKGIAFNTRVDIDRFELDRAGSILCNAARQRFRAKIRAEIGDRAVGNCRPTAAAPLYLTTPVVGMVAVGAPWLKM